MGKAFVHVCDVCDKRIEDKHEYSDPAGWFNVKITTTVTASGWHFLACDECLKPDASELIPRQPYFKRVCDIFRKIMSY